MFLLVPLAILLVSLVGIVWLIGRKFVYLKKLSPEIVEETAVANGNGGSPNFWAEFFPELAAKLEKSRWQKYKLAFLAESEKFLRKLRLVSLKIDASTNKLIHKIRQSLIHHEKMASEKMANGAGDIQGESEVKFNLAIIDKTKMLKEEEHRLIIEIAKNPNDAELYKELGKISVRLGEISDAVESFTKALELDPGDEEIRAKLERVKKKLEKISQE